MIVHNDLWCDACGRHNPKDMHVNMTLMLVQEVWPKDHPQVSERDRKPSDLCRGCRLALQELLQHFFARPEFKRGRTRALVQMGNAEAEHQERLKELTDGD